MRLVRRPVNRGFIAFFVCICTACSPKPYPVEIEFAAEWDGTSISCSATSLALSDLRFFVSDIVLTDTDGHEHALNLTPDKRWQQADVGLLDFENREGDCLNGSPDTNTSVRGTATASDIAGIRFTVGVPFDLNHANPLLANAPLDDPAMHWHWRSGYKFMRAGVTSANGGHWIHLGSTGCEGTIQNISGCRAPNRVTVNFPEFSPTMNRVVIDLNELFRGSDLGNIGESDCSSGPAEVTCTEWFAALGLPFGQNVGGVQHVFQVK